MLICIYFCVFIKNLKKMSQTFKNQFYLILLTVRYSTVQLLDMSATRSHFVKITLHLNFDGHFTPAGAIHQVTFRPIASNWRGLPTSPPDFPLASS